MLYGVCSVCVFVCACVCDHVFYVLLFVIYCVMLYNSCRGMACLCLCVRVFVWFVLMCLWMLLVMYCVVLCGLLVMFACCFVCGRVCCNNRVYVRDAFVMYCVMVRGLCLCVLSFRVRVLNLCVRCLYFIVWRCVWFTMCSLCLSACSNVFVCLVCGLLCDVVRFAFDACCFVFVCFVEHV